jgi:hypothetical protein
MMKLCNSFQVLVDIAKDIYGDKDCLIYFDSEMNIKNKKKKPFVGYTEKIDDKFFIVIDATLTFIQCAEILAHELAHLYSNDFDNLNSKEYDHNRKWKKCFDTICKAYQKKLNAIATEAI